MTTFDVITYWEERYAAGGDAGAGSRGELARRKAEFLNRYVAVQEIGSVLELGCGDGAQLALASYPHYLGLDVSPTAVTRCADRFGHDQTKRFFVYDPTTFDASIPAMRSELTLSIDVVYHLVEDATFERHMHHLFESASRAVIIYSTNVDDLQPGQSPHIRHRCFTRWVARGRPEWMLTRRVPIRGDRTRHDCDFFVFSHR